MRAGVEEWRKKMKILKNTKKEIHIQLDPVNVKLMWKQLQDFPDAPNWCFANIDGISVKISCEKAK